MKLTHITLSSFAVQLFSVSFFILLFIFIFVCLVNESQFQIELFVRSAAKGMIFFFGKMVNNSTVQMENVSVFI